MKKEIKILLIEDNSDHVEIIQYELSKIRQFKIDLEWVNSLSLGKAQLKTNEYDFVLADLSFPGSPAEDTLKELTTWIKNFNSPFVILTSLDDYYLGCEAIKLGFDDYLSKSNLSGYLLEKTIMYSMERKKIAMELRESRDWALEAAKAKSQFLAVMSHEIRTPLNGIVGSLNLLKESAGLSEEQEEFIDIINISSDSLLRIISDILDFSKIEAGKMLIEDIPFSLHDLIKSIQYIFVPIAENEKMIEFIAPIPTCPTNFKGDPGKIRQVLINLINNALKFTSEGYVLLNTKVKELSDKTEIIFEVEDSGTGILQEHVDKIFESFTQEDSSTTRKFGGTGLGLSISKKLSMIMGGDLTVKSEIGKGSTFTASVIVEKTEEKLQNNAESTATTFSGDVLLVEDNLINRKIATKILNKLNLTVDTAEDGQKAIDMCSEKQYDLIFMDLMMPILDGISATKQLKKEKFTTPIVAMTASAYEEDKRRCREAGMDGFISKPISKQEIINCLTNLLKK